MMVYIFTPHNKETAVVFWAVEAEYSIIIIIIISMSSNGCVNMPQEWLLHECQNFVC